MKLVKIQREMLANAINSELQYGVRKPIKVAAGRIEKNSGFSKSYENYSLKMQALLDANVIARANEEDQFAYIVDLDAAKTLLAQ